jgi:ATP-dependent helicase/nuclease subunit A
VMQYLDLSQPPERAGEQIRQMISDGMLSDDQAALVDEADIVWFLETPTGQVLRAGSAKVQRELPFLDARAADGCEGGAGMDRVMVRGRIDAAVHLLDGWLVIDYKTDRNSPEPGGERLQAYQKQVSLYRSAIERSGLGKVAVVRLVFLRARQILDM